MRFTTMLSCNVSLLVFKVKSIAAAVVASNGLEHAVVGAVLVSTFVQAMEHDPVSFPGKNWETGAQYLFFHAILDIIGLGFTLLFVCEFMLK